MKIVKRGRDPKELEPFPYVGEEYTCHRCGTVVQIQKRDKYKVMRTSHNLRFFIFACPVCKGNIHVY